MSDEIAHDPPPRGPFPWRRLAAVAVAAVVVAAVAVLGGQQDHHPAHSARASEPSPTPSGVSAAQTLHVPIPSGTLTGIANAGNRVWLANWDRGTVTAYDVHSGRSQITLRVGGPQMGPESIAAGGGAVWVLDFADNQVLRISASSGRITGRGSLAGLGEPLRLTYSAGAVWVSTDGARFHGDSREHVFKLDRRTLKVVAHKGLPGEGPGAMVIADRRGVWVTCAGDPQLALLNPSTLGTTVKTNIPTGQDAAQIDATPSGVWVLSDTDLRRLDPYTAYATTIIPRPVGMAFPAQLTVDRTGKIWIADGKTLQVFTPATGWRSVEGISGVRFLTSDPANVWIATGTELISLRLNPSR